MNKKEFLKQYGHCLYQENLLAHPQDLSLVKELEEVGYTIVSVHEREDEDDFIDMEKPCDTGTQPYKIGYYAFTQCIHCEGKLCGAYCPSCDAKAMLQDECPHCADRCTGECFGLIELPLPIDRYDRGDAQEF